MNFLETITNYEIRFLQKGPITKQSVGKTIFTDLLINMNQTRNLSRTT